jgi:tRNA threonylcarbamoyladenosine modification (KEOPS) complex  Pcc1 subunit
MSQKCKIRINLNEISGKKASSIKKALEPDNINFPDGLALNIEQNGNCLILNFQNEGDMKKLISTIDEVLEHTNIALEVIK